MASVESYLEDDHRRLDGLLRVALADSSHFDVVAFERFRASLLRHIGIEERLLLPLARRQRGGEPLPVAPVLRVEHGALASLLVPTPDRALALEIASLLHRHNAREEGPDGAYAQCAELAGREAESLLAKMRDTPEPPLAQHFDGQGVYRSAAGALQAAGRAFARQAVDRSKARP
jgi:hypothetical protein